MKKLSSSLIAFALTMGLCTPALAAGGTFSDVPSGQWYTPYVERAAANKWVNGIGGGLFSPDAHVTYGQFCTMIVNSIYPQDIAAQPSEGQWWQKYVSIAAKHNLLSMTHMEQASVWSSYANRDIPREEMAFVLYNAIKDTGAAMPTQSQLDAAQGRITDFAHLTFRSRSPVLTCYAMGLLSGYSDGRFGPDDTMTRAQAATVLCQVYDAINPSAPGGNQPDIPATNEPAPAVRPADAIGGQYDTSKYNVPADANKDGWITQSEVDARIEELKIQYPEGTLWNDPAIWGTDRNNPDGYIMTSGEHKGVHCYFSKSMFRVGYGCAAWAFLLSDRIFGDLPAREITDVNLLQTGDIEGTTTSSPHWDIYGKPVPGRENECYTTSDSGTGASVPIYWFDSPGSSVSMYAYCQESIDEGYGVVYTRYPDYPIDKSKLPNRNKYVEKDPLILYPEMRCGYCNFVMRRAGIDEFNKEHGSYFIECEKCGMRFCGKCLDEKKYDAHIKTCKG